MQAVRLEDTLKKLQSRADIAADHLIFLDVTYYSAGQYYIVSFSDSSTGNNFWLLVEDMIDLDADTIQVQVVDRAKQMIGKYNGN